MRFFAPVSSRFHHRRSTIIGQIARKASRFILSGTAEPACGNGLRTNCGHALPAAFFQSAKQSRSGNVKDFAGQGVAMLPPGGLRSPARVSEQKLLMSDFIGQKEWGKRTKVLALQSDGRSVRPPAFQSASPLTQPPEVMSTPPTPRRGS